MTKTTQSRADVARARKEHDRLKKAVDVAKARWIDSPALHRETRRAEYMDAKAAFDAKYPPPPLI